HTISKQSSFELRRMYDTTNECIHAIHNLGVDTPAWDPLIVHLLCKKLDPVTYTDFKESRKAPRELATFEEFMTFLENKFMALEPVYRKEKEVPSTSSSNHQIKQRANPYQTKTPYNKQPYSQTDKNYQVMATNIARCSLCKMDHDLFACKQFIEMTPNARLKSVHTLQVCKNCLYKHNGKPCTSSKRCKECNGKHNTMLHDPARVSSSVPTSKANQNNIYHVGLEAKETLLPTAVVNMRAADGTLVKIRALLDQAAQVSIISENLVQILGLKRYNSKISSPITGIDLCQKKCNGAVSVEIESMYHDYHYQTEALIVSKVAYDLPNVSFDHKPMEHLQDLSLADPTFNVSQRVDMLLGGDVYCDAIMNGLVKGPPGAPIAQETKLGWIISGSVTPLSCYTLAQNININEESVSIGDLSKYWEIEDINNSSPSLTESEKYCEDFYQQTTQRLEDGRYWSSNNTQLLGKLNSNQHNTTLEFKSTESRKTLGLKWNPTTDSFTYQNLITKVSDKPLTKRELLSELSKLFDPLGWLSPLSIRAKLLFQGTWSKKMRWDDKSSYQLNVHDVHHYVMVYVILCITVVGAIIAIGWRWRRNRSLAMARHEPAVSYEPEAAAPQPRPRANSVSAVHVHSEQVLRACEPECSVKG
ncbi:Uncharacterized protein OBRU01_08821, partial [Operophtera brumata]